MAMEMRGSLNVSKFQKTPQQPRFYGSAIINGVEYELKGWEKVNTKGEPWISLLFEQKGEQFEQCKPQSLFSRDIPKLIDLAGGCEVDNDDTPF